MAGKDEITPIIRRTTRTGHITTHGLGTGLGRGRGTTITAATTTAEATATVTTTAVAIETEMAIAIEMITVITTRATVTTKATVTATVTTMELQYHRAQDTINRRYSTDLPMTSTMFHSKSQAEIHTKLHMGRARRHHKALIDVRTQMATITILQTGNHTVADNGIQCLARVAHLHPSP